MQPDVTITPTMLSRYLLPVQKCQEGAEIRSLSDQELLAVMVGTGTRELDVVDLSTALLRSFGGLGGIASAGIRELARNKGIGFTKAVRIHAAFEMGRRVVAAPGLAGHLESPGAVWNLLLPQMACLDREEFRVLVLNNKNRLLKNAMVSAGTVSEAIVHPREVFRGAIREGGAAVIVAHNHPTGELTPSREDIQTTRRLAEAGNIVGIPLLDHVIITNVSYYSFKEGGYL
ncbi:MAG TPA: DNA repair protein RadC [Spirochaetota bacterium]|nr:DNA repair protein RadC [Spirochaetota bacterium]HPC42165.1 DNA repair protein RadC [Spirochaetota bacterium]HPL17043.1 DNA repair protein RadC [Spirochaetota bacterium]HQF09663.1 DNA repair protein RadC [Spirochaetota bacterium]HQH98459.1 DNA repair protein RadC [Spirochaetota bacterium]